MLLLSRLRSRPSSPVEPGVVAPLRPEATMGGSAPPPPREDAPDALRQTCELLEADLDACVADARRQSDASIAALTGVEQDVAVIAAEMHEVATIASGASSSVGSVAVAAEELVSAGREIAGQASASTSSARAVLNEAQRAGSTMQGLNQAVQGIGDIARLIGQIAERTNLLALNATIEAARAGEAGRGFAVVAAEVKALSRQTTTATDDIARRIRDIQSASTAAVRAVDAVQTAAREIDARSAAVAAAVEEQDATIRNIAQTVEQVAQGVGGVAGRMESIAGHCQTAHAATGEAVLAVTQTRDQIVALRQTVIVSLRSSVAGDRRAHVRVPVRIPAALRSPGAAGHGEILDLSEGGMLVRIAADFPHVPDLAPIEVDTAQFGQLRATVLGRTAGGLHLAFSDLPQTTLDAVRRLVDATLEADRRFIVAAQEAAGEIETALRSAVVGGAIDEAALFANSYDPIAGSDPPQVMAPFTHLTDRLFPPIQETLLAFDPRVAFAVAMDCNGYLPTHNALFSRPQRNSDPVWNAEHARNRRIFNDRAGLSAVRSTRPFLLQTYERDMGGGKRVLMKEADAPIRVQGRHWGGVRLAYRADAV